MAHPWYHWLIMIKLIIPAYNEEGNIEKFIRSSIKSLKKEALKIYVIDDGSQDKTSIILTKLTKDLPITLLKHPQNMGVAQTFKDGLNLLKSKNTHDNDIVIIAEGDGTSNPKLLPQIVQKIRSGADIVIASRFKKGGRYKNFPFKRMLFSLAANFILKTTFRLKNVTDYTIFYRGYRASLIKKAQQKYGQKLIETEKFVANAELLIKLSKLTDKIAEIPFVYDYGQKKGQSGLKILPNLFSYVRLFRHNHLS